MVDKFVREFKAIKGRGLIGWVKPGGTVDDSLKALYIKIAKSPQFAKNLEVYNKLAVTVSANRSASIDDNVKALGSDVTFSKIPNNILAGLFVKPDHPATTIYWIQANPFSLVRERVIRHELVHLGAAINGQGDYFMHEIAVQAATTPENLILGIGGFVVFVGGELYYFFTT